MELARGISMAQLLIGQGTALPKKKILEPGIN